MSDERSTPISHLNRSVDENETINKVMDKYNHLNVQNRNEQSQVAMELMPRPVSSGDIMELPPLQPNQRDMEEQFENRDINQDLYILNARDPILVTQYESQLKKSKDYVKSQTLDPHEEEEYDEYEEEYEYVEEPLWRRWLNEMRIVVFIVIFVTLFFNCNFGIDKVLCRYRFFGNENYDCNWKGVLLKSILVGIFAYMAIRFVRV